MHIKKEMAGQEAITFVVAVNKTDILEKNFLASPCLVDPHPHQILLQKGFKSASLAYNDAIDKSINDIIVFCHQDMFFPDPWISQLQQNIEWLNTSDPNWGVLGCSGITRERKMYGCVYSSGFGILGDPAEPMEIQTLDEIVLVLRKSSGLRFDERLPHFHLYGAEICLRAAMEGMKSYAISAFCVHNTRQGFNLPNEFYECCEYMRLAWKGHLPIETTCITITGSNIPVYLRRLKQIYLKHIRRNSPDVTQADDAMEIVNEVTKRDRIVCDEPRTEQK